MANIVIVGGGFSAAIASLILGDAANVVTPIDNSLQLDRLHKRRSELEINKIFSKNAQSLGDLKIRLKNGRLHDRLILGGNSSVWGGFVDTKDIPDVIREILIKNNIYIKPLDLKLTGSTSNIKSLSQFQSKSGAVFDVSQVLASSTNGYLESFTVDRFGIELNIRSNTKNQPEITRQNSKQMVTNKLILCVGVAQLLELLFKSKLIHEDDKISFSEFNCRFKVVGNSLIYKDGNDSCIIQYTLGRAICHALGIKKYLSVMRILDKLPFYINQEFRQIKSNFQLEIHDKTLVNSANSFKPEEIPFGKSIHYCDMKINGVNINKFLFSISPNIIGLGMPFVKQLRPGPISNDILVDAYKKLIINSYNE